MRRYFLDYIITLASYEYFDCYVLHRPTIAYEVIESAFGGYGLSADVIKQQIENQIFTEEEAKILLDFDRVMEEECSKIAFGTYENPKDWLHTDPHWLRIHEKAKETIQKLDVDLKAWEDEHIHWEAAGLERPEKYKRKAAEPPEPNA